MKVEHAGEYSVRSAEAPGAVCGSFFLQYSCKLQEHHNGDDADDDVTDSFQLALHGNVTEYNADDKQNDERGDGTHREGGRVEVLPLRRVDGAFSYNFILYAASSSTPFFDIVGLVRSDEL